MSRLSFTTMMLVPVGLAVASGCNTPAPPKALSRALDASTSNSTPGTASAPPTSRQRSQQAPPPPASSLWAQMAGGDGRAPVPLLPMMANHQKASMRDHLEAVEALVLALAQDDMKAVAKHGRRLGTDPKMTAMCNHMGAGAPGFTEHGLQFHRTADGLQKAADAGDKKAVLKTLGATLAQCNSCHRTYRQELVDMAGFQKASGNGDARSSSHAP